MNNTSNKSQKNYIYESPDNGKTIYKRVCQTDNKIKIPSKQFKLNDNNPNFNSELFK